MKTLVQRLREYSEWHARDGYGAWLDPYDADAAADLIDQLQADYRLIKECSDHNAALGAKDRERAEAAEARLAEAVEVVRGLMEWAEPLAGDNCDPLAASEETRSVEFARAFLAKLEGRSGV